MKKSSILWCAAAAIWIAALAGCGAATDSMNPAASLDTSPPQAPAGLAVATDASGARALVWTANTEPDLGSYQVYEYSPAPGRDNSYALAATVGASTTSWALPSGDVEVAWYKVRAVDRAGNRSGESGPFQVVLVPGPTGKDDPTDDANPKHH